MSVAFFPGEPQAIRSEKRTAKPQMAVTYDDDPGANAVSVETPEISPGDISYCLTKTQGRDISETVFVDITTLHHIYSRSCCS